MPRKKQKVYEYTHEGKFVKEWESIGQLYINMFPERKSTTTPFINNNRTIDSNGKVYSLDRIGSIGVRKYIRKKESPYVNKHGRTSTSKYVDHVIVVVNLDGEEIAGFIDVNTAVNMLSIQHGNLYSKIRTGSYDKKGLKYIAVPNEELIQAMPGSDEII